MPDYLNITGVGIGALAVILFYKLAATHIRNNTEAIKNLSTIINELKIVIRNQKI